MTAHTLDNLWSLPQDILARFENGARLDAKSIALVDETVALRRCTLYRKAFKVIAVSYPAALLDFDALAAWIRHERAILLSRISLAGLDVGERCLEPRILRRVAEAMGEVIGDACARHRYPRPALTLSPSPAALLPA